jgi:SsrA-binding protein
MAASRASDIELVTRNRRALFDYAIEEKFEAGLVLVGSEVKSLRAGKLDIGDAYVAVERGEAWLRQMFVAPFAQANAFPHEPRRPRKLLLHAREVSEIDQAISRGGSAVVPLSVYFKKGRAKVEVAIAVGRKKFDKRAHIAERDAERETRAALRGRRP